VSSHVAAPAAVAVQGRSSGVLLQRQCACGQHTSGGGECEECKKKSSPLQRKTGSGSTAVTAIPAIVHDVLRSPGQALDGETRAYMEPRFRHDFSRVRVHTDESAGRSAQAVNARAYTVGAHVVFGSQFKPGSGAGRRLLAHELTHVVQQASVPRIPFPLRVADSLPHEREAEQVSSAVAAGRSAAPALSSGSGLARFSDTGHHIIEEAALGGAGFSSEQIKAVEKGNVQRDYSQIGKVGNALLLCQPKDFGGYSPPEHFDNFIFDAVTDRWRTRGTGKQFRSDDPTAPDRSPIDYIETELTKLATDGLSDKSLVHLGNAFHTVEDFFAHSNFVELINNDYSLGRELATGSVTAEKGNEAASLGGVIASISDPSTRPLYERTAVEGAAQTEPRSHAHMSKDVPTSRNYEQARRLAALVIQDLGTDVIAAMKPKDAEQRIKLMSEMVLPKIRHYLRPPGKDRWWEQLRTRDRGAIDTRLDEAERRTPVTVNQCLFSPLKNIEASSSSSIKIPFGVALPVQIGKGYVWFQAGAGVTSLPLERPNAPDSAPQGGQGAGFAGIQIGGRF
jgi:Domain of unknown function (DUF4157)/Heterokaryon incompatibility protein Het-C